MRGIFLTISAMLLAGQAHSEQLTVASWNLEHFTGIDGAGCKPRDQAAYDEIRNIINAVDADVWLFQEVDTVGSLARVMDTSGWKFQMEHRQDHLRPGQCTAAGGEQTMQRTVTAVKRRIPVVETRDLSFVDVSGHGALRHGVSTTLMLNSQPLEVVNVHLKAGCPEGREGDACSALFNQVPYLAAYAREQDAKNLPLLIGGDLNRRLAEAGDAVMKTLGYNQHLGLSIVSHAGPSICSLKGEAPIDYQLASRALSDLTADVEAYEHSFTGPFETWPSDHCPNVVSYSF